MSNIKAALHHKPNNVKPWSARAREIRSYFPVQGSPIASKWQDSKGRVSLPVETKRRIQELLQKKMVLATEFQQAPFCLSRALTSKLLTMAEKGIVSEKVGRPQIASDQLIREIAEESILNNQYSFRRKLLKKKIIEETNKRRQDENKPAITNVSPSVIRGVSQGLLKKYGIKKKVADVGTHARQVAVAEAFTALDFAGACTYIHKFVKHLDCVINQDAMSFKGAGVKDKIEVYALPASEYASGCVKAEVDTTASNEMGLELTIKKLGMGSCGGFETPQIYVLADHRLAKTEFDVYEVKGLSPGRDPGKAGYIMLCASRAMNVNAYKWHFRNVTIKFVESLRDFHDHGMDVMYTVTMDGEVVQTEIFQKDPEVQQWCKDFNITIMKGCASATEIQNLLDNSNFTKAAKNVVRNVEDEDLAFFDTLEKNILTVLKSHNEKYTSRGEIASRWINLAAKSCVRVWYGTARTSDPKLLTEGAVRTGMFKRGCIDGKYEIGFDQIMGNIKRLPGQSKITKATCDLLFKCVPETAELFHLKGEAPDADKCDIIRRHAGEGWENFNNDFVSRILDDKPVHQRRCIFFTSEEWRRIEYDKQRRNELEKLQKQLDKDARKANQEQIKIQKEATKRQKADEKKQREEAAREKEAAAANLGIDKMNKKQLLQYILGIETGKRTRNDDLELVPAVEPTMPKQKRQKKLKEVVRIPTRRATLKASFEAHKADPRQRRTAHVVNQCACVACIDKPFNAHDREKCDMKACFVSKKHLHIDFNCWMKSSPCALCLP